MDNKRTYIGMGLLILVSMSYILFLQYYVKPHHKDWDWNGTLNQAADTQPSQPDIQSNGNTPASSATGPSWTSTASTPSIAPATLPSVKVISAPEAAKPILIGSTQPSDPDLALGLEIVPQGAALQAATINSYKNVGAKATYVFQEPYPDFPDQRSLAARSVTINGVNVDLLSAPWKLESSSPTAATYGVDLTTSDEKPLLHLSKKFELQSRGPKAHRDDTAAGYEVALTYHIQNPTTRPETVQLNFDGPTMPARESERSDDRQIVAGYDKGDTNVEIARTGLNEFKAGAEEKDLTSYKNYKFLWAGTTSGYFSAVVQADNPSQIGRVGATCLNPNAESAEDRLVTLNFQTSSLALNPGGAVDVPLKVFMGPKERDLFEGDYYTQFPRTFNQLLSSSSSMCGFCASAWLVDRLVDLLRFFHFFFRDWGLAIIALVVCVRLALHPISKSSQVSMLKMQKMAPELERLKKKYGDDKEAFAKAQMELTKEMGIMPFLGCLPMFLQMPIWIALYSALQNDIVLRQAPFLWGLTWIHDLARPDRLISWDSHPFTVPFFGMKLVSLNVLPLVVATVMLIQQKMQPQPPTMTAEQEQQRKMMQWMSLAFSLFFYWMPSGLNLYILTSSSIAIWESKRIREHIKEREEQDKNRVIIDAKPTRQGKDLKKLASANAKPQSPGLLAGWWLQMQNKVEEIRKEAEKKNKR